MSKSSLSVKVKTTTLIKALEEALAQREKLWANQEKETERYEKETEAYNASLIKLIKSGKGTITEASENSWHNRHEPKAKTKTFSVTVELPKSVIPVEPKQKYELHEHTYTRETDAIKQGIRIQKMTDKEYVNASTYRSVAEYL